MYRRSILEEIGDGPLACVLPLLALLAFVAFLAALGRAARLVTAENRRLEPGQVWLNLVPVFTLVWLPITIDRLAESVKRELLDRGQEVEGSTYGRAAGLAWLGCWAVAFLFVAALHGPPPLGWLIGVVGFVCWVSYWAQVNGLAARLKSRQYTPPADEGW
jgi:hypothetical protein